MLVVQNGRIENVEQYIRIYKPKFMHYQSLMLPFLKYIFT